MNNMKLSKDQLIKIIMAIVIIVLLAFVIADNRKDTDFTFDLQPPEEGLFDEESGQEATTTTTTVPKTTTTQPSPSTAVTTTPTSTGSCYPGLSGKKLQTPQGISLAWTPCTSDNFQFYKLVKSSLNSNPSYPNDPVAMSSSNKNASSFIDKTVAPHTTYYYRVCVIERLGKVTCGNTVSVTY
jgi:hypothetical protein